MIVLKKRPYLYNWSGNSIYYELYEADSMIDSSAIFEVAVYFRLVNQNNFLNIITIPFSPLNGTVKFNLQDILHVHLVWQIPDLAPAAIVPCGQQSGEFFIKFRKTTADDPNPVFDDSQAENTCFVFKGGIHLFSFKGNNYWINYFPTKKPFFTWQLSGRLTARTERMYLSWLNLYVGESGKLQLKVVVTFTDASTDTKIIAFDQPMVNWIYYCSGGAAELNLQSLQPTKEIWFWDIRIEDVTQPVATSVSETFRYYADNRNDYSGITLMYRNSIGGLDSVRVRGVVDPTTEYSFIETTTVLKSDYFIPDVLPAIESVQDAREEQTFKGDIGYLGKEEQDRLRDAFLQRQIYQEVKNKWVPIKLLTKSLKLANRKDKVFSLPIEWQLADGGSYFYTPGTVDLGPGTNISNITDALVVDIDTQVTFNQAGTVATASHTFTIESETGEQITAVWYRIGSQGNWIPTVYPYISPLHTEHDPNKFIVISFRALFNGNPGQYTTKVFNTFRSGIPTRSSIINTSQESQGITFRINDTEITPMDGVELAPEAHFDFDMENINNAYAKLVFPIATPQRAQIYTDGKLFEGSHQLSQAIEWFNVKLVSPITVIF